MMTSLPLLTAAGRFRTLLLAICLWTLMRPASGQHIPYIQYLDHPWVDSVLATLTPEEKVAQSVWMLTGGDRSVDHYVKLDRLIREYGIGGVVFTGSAPEDPEELADLSSYYRSVSRVPLAVATGSVDVLSGASGSAASVNEDLSWAAGHDGYTPQVEYPGTMALQAITDDTLLTRLGIHWSSRLIGQGSQVLLEPVHNVQVAEVFAMRHQLLSVKYQPGGNAPKMEHALSETTGFSSMIGADAAGTVGLAACFEPDVVSADQFPEEIQRRLDAAGVDAAVIDQRARMVLAFKYWAGLDHENPPSLPFMRTVQGEIAEGTTPAAREALIRELWADAITVLNDKWEVLPLKELDQKHIACLSVNRPAPTPFQQMADNYTRVSNYAWIPGGGGQDSLLKILTAQDVVLAGIYWPGPVLRENPGLRAEAEQFIRDLSEQTYLIAVWFGPPEALEEEYAFLKEAEGLVITYEENAMTGELAAQLIFGGIGARGRLPVAIGEGFPAGSGIRTDGNLRLQYALPESAGLSSAFLDRRIDSIVAEGLAAGAYPGCEVMAARNGKVIFHRNYGYHTYDRRVAVQKEDLYDLASVTKVSAPLAGLMVLEGMGRFSYTGQLGDYTDAMKRSDKADLPLKDILAHQAGLYPWIPYWQDAVKNNGEYKRRYIRVTPDDRYSQGVADHLYLKDNYRRKIYRSIRQSDLGEKTYVYSGLSFFIFPEIIEDLSGEPYEDFLKERVYDRIGAFDITFNPLRYYPMSRIVPTEYDSLFRKQQIQGYVHDEGAAMMGGYSGNAGLFSTANDLLKLFEMYRRMGTYGGEEIIPEEVLREYTSYQFPETGNRRGLGFDKPLVDGRDGTPRDYPCPGASPASFGHSGFTGTFAWSDPAYGITYVFLSNRVYPTRENNLLSEMDIRTNILQALYDAIRLSEPEPHRE